MCEWFYFWFSFTRIARFCVVFAHLLFGLHCLFIRLFFYPLAQHLSLLLVSLSVLFVFVSMNERDALAMAMTHLVYYIHALRLNLWHCHWYRHSLEQREYLSSLFSLSLSFSVCAHVCLFVHGRVYVRVYDHDLMLPMIRLQLPSYVNHSYQFAPRSFARSFVCSFICLHNTTKTR